MQNKKLIIGIDVGKDTGFAIFENKKLTSLQTLNTYTAVKYLQENKNIIKTVVMESSKKQKYVWNAHNTSKSAGNKISRNVGEIDGQCAVFIQCCEFEKIKLIEISPKQKGKKLSHLELTMYLPEINKMKENKVKTNNNTNQHERDAVMCVMVAKNNNLL